MPTECFFNLPQEKQMKIMGAALCELARVPADEISINKIIHNAGISRGSFYQYFKDKFDLLGYILSDFKNRVQGCLINNQKKYNGDIFKMTKAIYEETILLGQDEHNLRIMKNFFLSMKFTKKDRLYFLKLFDIPQGFFAETTESYLKHNKFRYDSFAFAENVSEMIFLLMKQSFTDIFCDYENAEEYKKDFYIQLDIIRHGVIEK